MFSCWTVVSESTETAHSKYSGKEKNVGARADNNMLLTYYTIDI